jgi:hypothetical protein
MSMLSLEVFTLYTTIAHTPNIFTSVKVILIPFLICDIYSDYLELSHDKIYRYRYFLHQMHKTRPNKDENNHKFDM